MSKLRLYQVYDNVAMTVAGIILAKTRDEAVIREFSELLANTDTTPGKYPEDYSLLYIGQQNQDTGEIEPCDPQTIFTGRVWLRLKAGARSPANDNGAGEQAPTFLSKAAEALSDAASDAEEAKRRILELRANR